MKNSAASWVPGGLACAKVPAAPSGAPPEDLDTKGAHASTSKVGGAATRKDDALVRLLARLLRAAGYQVLEEVWAPRWDRPVIDPATGRLTEVPAGQEAAVARLLRAESGSDVED